MPRQGTQPDEAKDETPEEGGRWFIIRDAWAQAEKRVYSLQ